MKKPTPQTKDGVGSKRPTSHKRKTARQRIATLMASPKRSKIPHKVHVAKIAEEASRQIVKRQIARLQMAEYVLRVVINPREYLVYHKRYMEKIERLLSKPFFRQLVENGTSTDAIMSSRAWCNGYDDYYQQELDDEENTIAWLEGEEPPYRREPKDPFICFKKVELKIRQEQMERVKVAVEVRALKPDTSSTTLSSYKVSYGAYLEIIGLLGVDPLHHRKLVNLVNHHVTRALRAKSMKEVPRTIFDTLIEPKDHP
jgi:protein required for attachment to host cells